MQRNVRRIDVLTNKVQHRDGDQCQRVPDLRYHMLQIDPNLGHRPRHEERVTESDRAGKPFISAEGTLLTLLMTA